MIEIRRSAEGDAHAIGRLYPDAFPEEDLLPVVRRLLQDPGAVTTVNRPRGRLGHDRKHALRHACGLETGRPESVASQVVSMGVVAVGGPGTPGDSGEPHGAGNLEARRDRLLAVGSGQASQLLESSSRIGC